LSTWAAFFIASYSPEAAKLHNLLITDETTWELLLRRAGLNAYAAQIILANLKLPEGASQESAGQYGLPGFVNMSPVVRIREFAQLMGGDRVLQRVGRTLDLGWS
jgi:hypothetical protein